MRVLRSLGVSCVALASVVSLLAGCGGPGEQRHGGGRADAARPAAPGGNRPEGRPPAALRLDLPFDAYKWDDRDVWLLERARYTLVARCVRERGLDFTMPRNTADTGPPAGYDNSRRYGVADPRAVSRYGYHLPADPDGDRRRRRLQVWSEQVSAAEESAIYGDGTEGDLGCYGQADAVVDRGVAATADADDGWLAARSSATLERSGADPEVVRARVRWRDCMFRAGFRHRDPDAAGGDARWNLDGAAVPAAEVATARADVRCKESSGLLRSWHAAETALQRDAVGRDRPRFDRIAAARATRLGNARVVLAGEQPK